MYKCRRCGNAIERCREHQLREARDDGFFRGFCGTTGAPGFSTEISGKIALRSKASRDYGVNSFIRAILAWAIAQARSKIWSSNLTRAISRNSLAEMELALRPCYTGIATFPGCRSKRRKFANEVYETLHSCKPLVPIRIFYLKIFFESLSKTLLCVLLCITFTTNLLHMAYFYIAFDCL